MKRIKYLLNLPWTIVAGCLALISVPINFSRQKDALIFSVKTIWWHPQKGVRAVTLGNIVILGSNVQKYDLNHELIHVEQHMREPLVHPLFSFVEVVRHGHEHSKYEQEKYQKAGNLYDRRP